MMEKTLRVLGGGEEGGHSHSHSHSVDTSSGHATGVSSSADGLRNRDKKSDAEIVPVKEEDHGSASGGPSKLSAYLNLFGDFVHNMFVLKTCLGMYK